MAGLVEGVDDDVSGDAYVGGDAQSESGVVIEPDQDFGVRGVVEPVVGEV